MHEGRNLLLVDIRLDNLVHHLIELFLANLLGRGDLSLLESLANLFLDIADLMLLTGVDDAERCSFLTGTTGTARAVGVVLDVIRESVVDDMSQVINVQAACCHISSNQQLNGMLAEFLHRQVTLLL